MALPLLGILAAELGVLGGVQFLRNKADDKSADAAAQQFQGFMGPGGAGESIANNNPLAAAGLIDRMLKIRESDDGFLNTGKTQGINSLFAEAQAMLENQQAQEQLSYDRNQDLIVNSRAEANELDKDYRASLGQFKQLSEAARGAFDSLQYGTKADALFSLYSVMGVVDPGGRITDSEQNNFDNLAGFLGLPAQFMRDLQGKGLGPTERQDLINALQRRFAPLRSTAINQRDYFRDRRNSLLQRGYEIQDPEGTLGIDWKLGAGQKPSARGGGGQGVQPGPVTAPPGNTSDPAPQWWKTLTEQLPKDVADRIRQVVP